MKQEYQEYIVQKIYEFKVKARNVHEAHDKSSNLMWKGAVGCSAVTEKEQKERHIALGMEEEYNNTLLSDPIFTDLAEATGMCIDDFASLKRAIEHLNTSGKMD